MTRIGLTFLALHSRSGGTAAPRTTKTCVPCGMKFRISTPSQASSHGHTCSAGVAGHNKKRLCCYIHVPVRIVRVQNPFTGCAAGACRDHHVLQLSRAPSDH